MIKYFWIATVLFSLFQINVYASLEYDFGDSPTVVKNRFHNQCSFSTLKTNSQWSWVKTLECTGYKFQRVLTKLIFEFSDNKLSRVYIVSIDIPNYFLIRSKNNLLIEKASVTGEKNKSNPYRISLFSDRVHRYENGHVLTYFYYQGKWEWELKMETSGYAEEETEKKRKQLEDEAGKGLSGWANFKFDDEVAKMKENLEGLCTSIEIDNRTYLKGKKVMICSDFPFIGKKITLNLVFLDARFVEAILDLAAKDYYTLLPLLKKKYGMPYQEGIETADHYPFIFFTKANITLGYDSGETQKPEPQVQLRYSKEGYFDNSKPIPTIKKTTPPNGKNPNQKSTPPMSGNDLILESL